jgi:hypothetical protein
VAAVAARLAAENGDAETLSRLERAAERSGEATLGEIASSAKMLGGRSRAASPMTAIDVDAVTPEQYAYCVAVNRAATRARVTGNAEYILPLVDATDNVVLAPGLPSAAEASLAERIATVCGSLPQTPDVAAGGLDILAAESRRSKHGFSDDDDDDDWYRRREEERARQPVEVSGGGFG